MVSLDILLKGVDPLSIKILSTLLMILFHGKISLESISGSLITLNPKSPLKRDPVILGPSLSLMWREILDKAPCKQITKGYLAMHSQ